MKEPNTLDMLVRKFSHRQSFWTVVFISSGWWNAGITGLDSWFGSWGRPHKQLFSPNGRKYWNLLESIDLVLRNVLTGRWDRICGWIADGERVESGGGADIPQTAEAADLRPLAPCGGVLVNTGPLNSPSPSSLLGLDYWLTQFGKFTSAYLKKY